MSSIDFEDTVFEKFKDIGDFTENIENADQLQIEQLDYIWVAETTDGEKLPQFKETGEEREYTEIRKMNEEGRIEAVYWTPVDDYLYDSVSSKDLVGVTGLTEKSFRIFRRGAQKYSTTGVQIKDTYAYAIEVDGVFCFISHRGESFVNGSGKFHPEVDS